MDLRALRALVEVVRQGGFSQAGKVICTTQSTVSKAVKQLEEELGLTLLHRNGHHCTLTGAGEIVYRRALVMLAERDDLLAELNELRGLKRGRLRIGLPPIGSDLLFAPVFADYRSRYPAVDVQLVEHGAKRLEEMVLTGELDMAASLLPVAETFAWQTVRQEPIHCVIPAEHPLAGQESVALADLVALPFILFETGFALNPMILDACRQQGVTPNVVARSSQINFIVELVVAGLGVGFLPRLIAHHRRRPGVVHRPLEDPALDWNMALIWRRGGYLSPAAQAWLALFQAGGEHPL